MLPCFAVLTKLGFRTSLHRAGNRKPNVDNMAKQGHITHILPSPQQPSHHFNVMLPDAMKRYISSCNDYNICVVLSIKWYIEQYIKWYIKQYLQRYIKRYIKRYTRRYIKTHIKRYITCCIKRYITRYFQRYIKLHIKRHMTNSTFFVPVDGVEE